MAELIYLTAVNLIAFAIFFIDKQKARNNSWRIRESTLIALAVLGGSYGAYLAMRLFHHKTRKPLFAWGIPVLMLMETVILILRFTGTGQTN